MLYGIGLAQQLLHCSQNMSSQLVFAVDWPKFPLVLTDRKVMGLLLLALEPWAGGSDVGLGPSLLRGDLCS